MARFRKTIEVEAVQWTGDNRDEVIAFVGALRSRLVFTTHATPLACIRMSDWQVMEVPAGDWMVEEPIGGSTGIRHVTAAEFADTYQRSGEAS